MAKQYVCPKHRAPLSLNDKVIEFAGSQYTVCVGVCPRCTISYISTQIMSCAKITIAGQTYEYLAGLPDSGRNQDKRNASTRQFDHTSSQRIDDIERFFLKAERENIQQDEYERLIEQNDALKRQLAAERAKLAAMEERLLNFERKVQQLEQTQKSAVANTITEWQTRIERLNRVHQDTLEETESTLREQVEVERKRISSLLRQVEALSKGQSTLEQANRSLEQKYRKTVAEYEERITRLNKAHRDAVAEAHKALRDQLEVERKRVAAFQQNNGLLQRQVDTLSKQLAEAKGPTRQVVFVDEKLYVCGGQIRCEKYNHQREDVTGIIDTVYGQPITMTVCRCKDCKLYYVRHAVFESYRERYGTLLGQFVRQTDGLNLGREIHYDGELAQESLLHMNGYNVSQASNLTPLERRKILMYVIESRIMDRNAIRNHLSYLIKRSQNNSTMEEAVSRWRSDLRWVNDYRSSQQDVVWLSGTVMYKHRRNR